MSITYAALVRIGADKRGIILTEYNGPADHEVRKRLNSVTINGIQTISLNKYGSTTVKKIFDDMTNSEKKYVNLQIKINHLTFCSHFIFSFAKQIFKNNISISAVNVSFPLTIRMKRNRMSLSLTFSRHRTMVKSTYVYLPRIRALFLRAVVFAKTESIELSW